MVVPVNTFCECSEPSGALVVAFVPTQAKFVAVAAVAEQVSVYEIGNPAITELTETWQGACTVPPPDPVQTFHDVGSMTSPRARMAIRMAGPPKASSAFSNSVCETSDPSG